MVHQEYFAFFDEPAPCSYVNWTSMITTFGIAAPGMALMMKKQAYRL